MDYLFNTWAGKLFIGVLVMLALCFPLSAGASDTVQIGTVVSVERDGERRSWTPGAGEVAGGAIGAALGYRMGGNNGYQASAVGAVAGAALGRLLTPQRSTPRVAVVVLGSGQYVAADVPKGIGVKPGDQVYVTDRVGRGMVAGVVR